jgi:hypothetical protein
VKEKAVFTAVIQGGQDLKGNTIRKQLQGNGQGKRYLTA